MWELIAEYENYIKECKEKGEEPLLIDEWIDEKIYKKNEENS